MDYLIQHGRKAYWQMLDITEQRHREYAKRHKMAYVNHREAILQQWPGYWDMIPLLLYLVRRPDTDYVFWLDADTLIVGDVDMRTALNGCMVGMTKHPGPPEHYNCGVLFSRACKEVATWLERVIDLGPGVYPWYQQNYLNEYIGFMEHRGMVKVLGNEWNSTESLGHSEDCYIRAWHGTAGGIQPRMALMKERIATL